MQKSFRQPFACQRPCSGFLQSISEKLMPNLHEQKLLASFYNASFDAFEASRNAVGVTNLNLNDIAGIEREILELENNHIDPFTLSSFFGAKGCRRFGS